ncbi:MAG TPA: lysophospholipid acyltransferase family protein [Polyangiaceae bacterium]|nr:lysophospholipid acyltransferase family protein [Polyangiaceae bacterium]
MQQKVVQRERELAIVTERAFSRDPAVALRDPSLPAIGRLHLRIVQKSLEPGWWDQALRLGQRTAGCNWIEVCTRNIRHVHGRERIGELSQGKSYVVVSNHRSFFDMYVITAYLVKRGMKHRIMFPVRSNFFYDSAAGIFVNAVMSFFAMYPPVFRDKKLAHLNVASLDETIRLLRQGGFFMGLHPEGTRNTGDPYEMLPARSGVGRIIHQARMPVLPVFINGLGNDLVKQVAGNFTRKGEPVNVVFGKPVDFGGLLEKAPSPRVFKAVSERAMEVVRELGQEEKKIREG